jgi:hypothetical protein
MAEAFKQLVEKYRVNGNGHKAAPSVVASMKAGAGGAKSLQKKLR